MKPHGSYKMSIGGHRVFFPDELPPRIQFAPQVLGLAEEATHMLGKVAMCRDLIPNADMMIYSSLTKEAIASSTIEGTVTSPDELMLFEIGQSRGESSTREVSNYRNALKNGCELLKTRPISLNLILELHSILMSGVRGQENRGRWKTAQNYIAPSAAHPIENSIFTPVAPENTLAFLGNLETYLNQPQREPRVIQCALAHHQFETIHPFADGNGRVGRLLIVLHLIQLGLLKEPLIYPSVYFERTRDEYVAGLQNVRFKGDWNAWCRYFITGIIAQCEMTIEFIHQCRALQHEIREKIPSVRRHATVDRVLDCFLSDLVWDMSQLRASTGLSFNAIKGAVALLAELGLVEQIAPHQRRNRFYICRPVYDLIFQRDQALK